MFVRHDETRFDREILSEVDVKTPGGDERNYKTSTGGSDFPRGRERERETERVCVKERERVNGPIHIPISAVME